MYLSWLCFKYKNSASMEIIITEEEILSTPNFYEMGKLVNNRYWQAKRDQEGPQIDEDYVHISVGEDGLISSINRLNEYDKCVICGKESPYLRTEHIDHREGYIEGSGQGCFNPSICGKR